LFISSAIALIVVVVVIGALALRPWENKSLPSLSAATPGASALVKNGFTLGQSGAPVTIDIYEDFQCPICREWYLNIYPQLRDGAIAAGEAKLVFHGFSFIGDESKAADRAAYAAAQQNRFWDMWATLYANQGTENSGAFSDARLRDMAQALNLNMTQFDADFASSAASSFVLEGASEAGAAGITGTPTLIIAGVPYTGLTDYTTLKAAIDAAK
jgi:protein-disulfide isomerase